MDKKMIDNPLPDQVMSENDEAYLSEQFYEHCEDKAKEIAKEFNLLPEFHNDFADYFTELCKQSDEGYSLINEKSIIDDWWEENSYMYDDYDEPYIIYKPQIQKSLPEPIEDYEPTDDEAMSSFGTKWHDGL